MFKSRLAMWEKYRNAGKSDHFTRLWISFLYPELHIDNSTIVISFEEKIHSWRGYRIVNDIEEKLL